MKHFRSSKMRTLSLCALGLAASAILLQTQTANAASKPAAKMGTPKSGVAMTSHKTSVKTTKHTMGTQVGLTASQKAKVAAINKEAAAKRAKVTADKSLSASARTAKYKAIAAEQQAQTKAAMSASQQAKYHKMQTSKKSTQKMAAKPAMKTNVASTKTPTVKTTTHKAAPVTQK